MVRGRKSGRSRQRTCSCRMGQRGLDDQRPKRCGYLRARGTIRMCIVVDGVVYQGERVLFLVLVYCYGSLGCLVASLPAGCELREIHLQGIEEKNLSNSYAPTVSHPRYQPLYLVAYLDLLRGCSSGARKCRSQGAEIHSGWRHVVLNFEHSQRA